MSFAPRFTVTNPITAALTRFVNLRQTRDTACDKLTTGLAP